MATIGLLVMSVPIKAQVAIGSDKKPEEFSILELVSPKEKPIGLGLRLPQLTLEQRNALATQLKSYTTQTNSRGELLKDLAKGLMIFTVHESYNCIEYWNGTEWVSLK